MPHTLIAVYPNGNYTVKLYSDGTKVKQTVYDKFEASFPDSIDLKITDYCDQGCPMCHEMSSVDGKHAELDAPFLDTLKKGTELAIGGGNPLSHPHLVEFLTRMKARGIICNITINANHISSNRTLISQLIRDKLIYGLGISISAYNEDAVTLAQAYPHAVLHLINGVFADYDKISGKCLKLLILGYKMFGRGQGYFSSEINERMEWTKRTLPSLFGKFKLISFDNLALEQLEVKSLITPEEYDSMYMGDDGEASMYIDLVKGQFAKGSTSNERYPIENDIIKMFKSIQVKKD